MASCWLKSSSCSQIQHCSANRDRSCRQRVIIKISIMICTEPAWFDFKILVLPADSFRQTAQRFLQPHLNEPLVDSFAWNWPVRLLLSQRSQVRQHFTRTFKIQDEYLTLPAECCATRTANVYRPFTRMLTFDNILTPSTCTPFCLQERWFFVSKTCRIATVCTLVKMQKMQHTLGLSSTQDRHWKVLYFSFPSSSRCFLAVGAGTLAKHLSFGQRKLRMEGPSERALCK